MTNIGWIFEHASFCHFVSQRMDTRKHAHSSRTVHFRHRRRRVAPRGGLAARQLVVEGRSRPSHRGRAADIRARVGVPRGPGLGGTASSPW